MSKRSHRSNSTILHNFLSFRHGRAVRCFRQDGCRNFRVVSQMHFFLLDCREDRALGRASFAVAALGHQNQRMLQRGKDSAAKVCFGLIQNILRITNYFSSGVAVPQVLLKLTVVFRQSWKAWKTTFIVAKYQPMSRSIIV